MNYDYNARDLLEQQILGSIMAFSNENHYIQVRDLIVVKHGLDSPEYFYSNVNQNIFIAILKCWENEVPATSEMIITFRGNDYIDKSDFSNYKSFDIHVLTCFSKSLSSFNFDSTVFLFKRYILIDYWNNKANDILYNDWSIRDVLEVSENITDGFKILLDKISKNFQKNNVMTPKQRIIEEHERVKRGDIIWIPTGIPPADAEWKGWWNGDVTIIAARPSMGKSALMIASAMNAAFNYHKRVGFFSLEMDKVRLMNHIISAKTNIKYDRIKSHQVSDEEFKLILKWYDWFEKDSPLRIYDVQDAQTLDQITGLIPGHDVVFIDYLQLTKLKKSNSRNTAMREQDVAEISRGFKLSAMENKIPLIAGAQLNRSVDSRPGNMPILSDLRESGSIEQDADNVFFPLRPAYYEQINHPDAIIPTWQKGNFVMRGAKTRDGATETVKFHMDMTTYEFTDGHLTGPKV